MENAKMVWDTWRAAIMASNNVDDRLYAEAEHLVFYEENRWIDTVPRCVETLHHIVKYSVGENGGEEKWKRLLFDQWMDARAFQCVQTFLKEEHASREHLRVQRQWATICQWFVRGQFKMKETIIQKLRQCSTSFL